MPRFIVIHNVTAETQEQVFQGAQAVARGLPEGVTWLNSWWVPEMAQLICEWDAPDPQAIHQATAPITTLFPIESVYEVEWIDPKWYITAREG